MGWTVGLQGEQSSLFMVLKRKTTKTRGHCQLGPPALSGSEKLSVKEVEKTEPDATKQG